MRDTQQCLAKAAEMLDAAQSCSDELAVIYKKLAADWYLLARQSVWMSKFRFHSGNTENGLNSLAADHILSLI